MRLFSVKIATQTGVISALFPSKPPGLSKHTMKYSSSVRTAFQHYVSFIRRGNQNKVKIRHGRKMVRSHLPGDASGGADFSADDVKKCVVNAAVIEARSDAMLPAGVDEESCYVALPTHPWRVLFRKPTNP
jgi:hypothetical protein